MWGLEQYAKETKLLGTYLNHGELVLVILLTLRELTRLSAH